MSPATARRLWVLCHHAAELVTVAHRRLRGKINWIPRRFLESTLGGLQQAALGAAQLQFRAFERVAPRVEQLPYLIRIAREQMTSATGHLRRRRPTLIALRFLDDALLELASAAGLELSLE